MYNKFVIAILLCTMFISACGTMNQEAEQQEQIQNELDPARDDGPSSFNEENRLGYVHYTRDQLNNDDENNHAATMDRHKIADMISRIILRNEGFDEVATLVTDKEVLIAYGKNDELEDKTAADIAKKTALSIMPGFFHVYVSDNRSLIPDIQSLHNSNTQQGTYRNTITSIIEEMKKSPQGIENENK
ncbi:YhcN/YlaJ family sporulation lipoprotein [Virgibacillus necropolis]|uniref:YhcN/YlaJ family sporulation lipoprotein n=1 Tax=Virgibacillus necropolis TaxID=163877 RepID=UPI00384CBD47